MTGRIVPVGELPEERHVGSELDVPATALAIGAHPDDIEFGCGGTLAKWAAAGCRIHHLVLTDGSKGSWEPGTSRRQLVEVRQGEQREAARTLGGGEVDFLGWPDGELQSGLDERRRVAEVIRRVGPAVVLGHDPWRRYRLHPDHRHAGWLALDAVVAARDPLFYEDMAWPAHRPDAVLLWEADEPNHVEDISATIDMKLAALLAHRSQYRSTMGEDLDDFAERVRARAAADRVPVS
ncbi:MAG: PIG-L deacetylase family protein [Acidimicrobiales bacterium]